MVKVWLVLLFATTFFRISVIRIEARLTRNSHPTAIAIRDSLVVGRLRMTNATGFGFEQYLTIITAANDGLRVPLAKKIRVTGWSRPVMHPYQPKPAMVLGPRCQRKYIQYDYSSQYVHDNTSSDYIDPVFLVRSGAAVYPNHTYVEPCECLKIEVFMQCDITGSPSGWGKPTLPSWCGPTDSSTGISDNQSTTVDSGDDSDLGAGRYVTLPLRHITPDACKDTCCGGPEDYDVPRFDIADYWANPSYYSSGDASVLYSQYRIRHAPPTPTMGPVSVFEGP